MIRASIDIFGLRELHWTGSGQFKSDDFIFLEMISLDEKELHSAEANKWLC